MIHKEGSSTQEKNPIKVKWPLEITCFASGASIMIIEIAAHRLLSPWFGNSAYTWTALISIVLLALSLGNYFGGKCIDKYPNPNVIKNLLILIGIICTLIPFLKSSLEPYFIKSHIIWGPFLSCFILFSTPCILLGMITPMVIKLVSLHFNNQSIGQVAGKMSMLATIGSFLGTILCGLILLSFFHINHIYLWVGYFLFFNAFLIHVIYRKEFSSFLFITIFCVGVSILSFSKGIKEKSLIYEDDSFYHKIRVYSKPLKNGDSINLLKLDTTVEGGQFKKSFQLPLKYQRFWKLSRCYLKHPQNIIFLGGGAFGMPIAASRSFPKSNIQVLEIDPHVINVGKKYFNLSKYKNIHPIADDARRFLQNTDQTFDFIFSDTYNGLRAIPPHLTTEEFFKLIHSRLSDHGIYMVNIISSVKGEKNFVFRAFYQTLRPIFHTFSIYALEHKKLEQPQNIILVAMKRDLPPTQHSYIFKQLLPYQIRYSNLNLKPIQKMTDSLNPIEHFISQSLL